MNRSDFKLKLNSCEVFFEIVLANKISQRLAKIFYLYFFYLQYKRKLTCTKLLAKGLQLACERLAEGEASEARQAFKRLASG